MLAKIWKKLLLAICIIACIYNIMSKLVNRASLEANLERANDGNTVFDFSIKKNENTSEVVVNKNTINTNKVDNNITIDGENTNTTAEENVDTAEIEEEKPEENSSTFKFTDFIFKW